MSDFHAIEEVISLYFKGLHEGDVSLVHTLFLPTAGICGYYEGELVNMNHAEYLSALRHMSPPLRIGEEFNMRISGIDYIGNTPAPEPGIFFRH